MGGELMQDVTAMAVVEAWHDALNREDSVRVVDLSDPNIEIVGPRGSGYGRALLREWLNHARVQLEIQKRFVAGDTVVVAQRGIWHSPETGQSLGEANVASVFRVKDGRVAYYARYDALEDALLRAGLSESDEG